jgi:hypothetical protein
MFLMVYGCKKSKNDAKFKSTTYQTLGAYESTGKPNYLYTKDSISTSLLSYINSILKNGQDLTKAHPEYFSSSLTADIAITQSSDVFVTFVSQDGGYTNSLAFYTYPTIQPIKSDKDIQMIKYIFPNSGIHTPLKPGDKAKLEDLIRGLPLVA